MSTLTQSIERYYALKDTLTARQAEDAEFARGQAMAYAWGRVDAGDTFDPDMGVEFAWTYATVRTLAAVHDGYAMSIQDSWRSFRKHGVIRGHDGRNLAKSSR